jgi:hypothetical protein
MLPFLLQIGHILRKASKDLIQTSSQINLMKNMTGLEVLATEMWYISRDLLTEIEILLHQSPGDTKPSHLTKVPATNLTKERYLYLVIRDSKKTFQYYAQVFDEMHNLHRNIRSRWGEIVTVQMAAL